MEHKTEWLIPKRVMFSKISGVFDEAEMVVFDREALEMMEDGDPDAALIHRIIDVTGFIGRPSLKKMNLASAPRNPRNGWMLVVGVHDPLIKMVGAIAAQMFNMRVREVKTVEEALTFLYQIDATLPKLSAQNPEIRIDSKL